MGRWIDEKYVNLFRDSTHHCFKGISYILTQHKYIYKARWFTSGWEESLTARQDWNHFLLLLNYFLYYLLTEHYYNLNEIYTTALLTKIRKRKTPKSEFESESQPWQGCMIGHYTIWAGLHTIITALHCKTRKRKRPNRNSNPSRSRDRAAW